MCPTVTALPQLMSLEFILDFLRSLGHLMETVILKGLQAETSIRDQDNVIKRKIRAWIEAENMREQSRDTPRNTGKFDSINLDD